MDNTVPQYLLPDLLQLLRKKRGEQLQIQVGLPPFLVIQGEDYEVEGPVITEAIADRLFRSVADSRQIREFREHGIGEFVYKLASSRFLVRASQKDGYFRLDLTLVTG
jgi:Tfp pilus assembly ATPase PilU